MLWKLLKDTNAGQKPTHLAVIFDKSSKTFRNDIYPALQGAAPRAAGRSPPAVRTDPPGDPRLQRARHRAGQFRGRRSHRHLCAPGGGGRRHLPHRLFRQGPDAADPPRRDALRHDEGPRRGRGRGAGEVRRDARQGDRRAVAGGRLGGQCAGRAGDRREDGRTAPRGIRRSRNPAGARLRDQAAEAAREPDRSSPSRRASPSGW